MSRSSLRIALLQRNLSGWRGGVRVTIQLAHHLVTAGHSVTLVGPRPTNGQYRYPLPDSVVVLEPKPRCGVENNLNQNAAKTEAMIRAIPAVDLVIASNCFDALAAATSRTRWVYYVQALEAEDPDLLEPELQKLATSSYQPGIPAVAVSSHVAKHLAEIYNMSSTVITPAVDDQFYGTSWVPRPKRRDIFRVSYAGALTAAKGISDLWTAMRILDSTKIQLHVATQSNLDRAPWQTGIQFHKPQSDEALACFYRDSDLIIHPSYHEAFGLAPLEAMACGTATVVCDSGGVQEYAVDQHNTILLPPRRPDLLGRAIGDLYRNPDLRDHLRRNGRTTAVRFQRSIIGRTWAEWLRAI
jgi:glycosyltransferase involved in cell wall biosynthesis